MVERLKAAIDKARAQRSTAHDAPVGENPPVPARSTPLSRNVARAGDGLASLAVLEADPLALNANRIVAATRTDPGSSAFDLMRTRLLKLCRDAGWRRIGITSPTKGCGKSTICMNLGFSIARNPSMRALVVDLDMRAPQIAKYLGAATKPRRMALYLRREAPMEAIFARIGDNLAVGLDTESERNSAELLSSPDTVTALNSALDALKPDIALFDLPPVLASDDAVAFAPFLDGMIVVASADATTAAELTECERLLSGTTQLIGVVLNKCRVESGDAYAYDYEKS